MARARRAAARRCPRRRRDRLLARQLRQLPRWLQQTRYNGPPPLKQPRGLDRHRVELLQQRGAGRRRRRLAWEGYEAKLRDRQGARRDRRRGDGLGGLGAVRPRVDRRIRAARPRSAYNPAVSADGRFVAFESAEGNLNFAKRYGQMRVYVTDLRDRAQTALGSLAIDFAHDRHSAYNPSLSADGRVVAYETSESARGALDVWVTDLRHGTLARVPDPAGVLERPLRAGALARRAVPRVHRAGTRGRHSAVFLRDLRTRRTARVSGAGQEAWEPVVSPRRCAPSPTPDGDARRASPTCDRARRRRRAAPTASTAASEPSLSADGRARRVHRPRRRGAHARLRARPAPRRDHARLARVRASTGPPAMGASDAPVDLRRRRQRRVHLGRLEPLAGQVQPGARDLRARPRAATRRRWSRHGDGANRGHRADEGLGGEDAMRIALLVRFSDAELVERVVQLARRRGRRGTRRRA